MVLTLQIVLLIMTIGSMIEASNAVSSKHDHVRWDMITVFVVSLLSLLYTITIL